MKYKTFEDYVDATSILLLGGTTDPSYRDIAKALDESECPPQRLEQSVLDSIPKLRMVLRDRNAIFETIHTVGYPYYREFKLRGGMPTTEAEASRCLPSGRGNRAEGLRLALQGDDLIYWMSLDRPTRSAEVMLNNGRMRIERAIQGGRIAAEHRRPLLIA